MHGGGVIGQLIGCQQVVHVHVATHVHQFTCEA
jgi:hypothetical protein